MSTNRHDLKLRRYVDELESDPEFVAEGVATEFIEVALRIVHERGLSQSWLADKLGVSRSHISKIMRAPPNMTILTMARIAQALGTRLHVSMDAVQEPRHLERDERRKKDSKSRSEDDREWDAMASRHPGPPVVADGEGVRHRRLR